jgi:hypothetical protein
MSELTISALDGMDGHSDVQIAKPYKITLVEDDAALNGEVDGDEHEPQDGEVAEAILLQRITTC